MTALTTRLVRRVSGFHGPLAGIVLMMTSSLINTGMAVLGKTMVHALPPFEVVFFRHMVAFLVVAPFLLKAAGNPFRTTAIRMHVLRAVLNIGAVLCYFTALGLITLEEVTALNFIAPIIAMVLAVLFLREAMTSARWLSLVLGVVGALIILRPGMQGVSVGALLVVASSTCWGATMICIKVLGRTERATVIAAFGSMMMAPILFVLALIVWVWPTPEQFVMLIAMGILGALGQVTISQAFREADAAVVLPIDFVKLVWASLFGYALFAETPDILTWAGGAIVFTGVLWISYAERGRRRAAP